MVYLENKCPKGCKGSTHQLSTSNEWKYYCPLCDSRFNEDGQLLAPNKNKEPNHGK